MIIIIIINIIIDINQMVPMLLRYLGKCATFIIYLC